MNCDRCGKPDATVERVQAGSHWYFHPECEASPTTVAEREGAELRQVRTYEDFIVEVYREQLTIYYPDGHHGFMVRLTDEQKQQLAEALHPALLAARRETEREASSDEINRAVRTFRSLENRRNDYSAMLEVLDEYDRNRHATAARPNATRPFRGARS
jgi:hypothetical protein